MPVVAIIAEYNPFHMGHVSMIKTIRKEFPNHEVIILLSGHFVQRGEPSFFNKFLRTETALKNGIDLVLELPSVSAAQHAGLFARNAVHLLEKSGIVDVLAFGIEESALENLIYANSILTQHKKLYKKMTINLIKKGMTYPKARQVSLENITQKNWNFINNPNTILALEYLQALQDNQSNIKIFPIPRTGSYHSKDLSYPASSQALRNALQSNNANMENVKNNLPPSSYSYCFDTTQYHTLNHLSQLFNYLLKTQPLDEIYSMSSELYHALKNASSHCFLISDYIHALKKKHNTYLSLQRLCCHILLGIKKEDILLPPYLRVLGFRHSKKHLLTALSKNSSLPIITNMKKRKLSDAEEKFFQKDLHCGEIYQLSSNKPTSAIKNELSEPLVIIS